MVASFRLHPTFDGSGDAIRVEHVDETPTLSASACEGKGCLGVL